MTHQGARHRCITNRPLEYALANSGWFPGYSLIQAEFDEDAAEVIVSLARPYAIREDVGGYLSLTFSQNQKNWSVSGISILSKASTFNHGDDFVLAYALQPGRSELSNLSTATDQSFVATALAPLYNALVTHLQWKSSRSTGLPISEFEPLRHSYLKHVVCQDPELSEIVAGQYNS